MFDGLAVPGRIDIHPGCQTLLGCNRVAEVILYNDVIDLFLPLTDISRVMLSCEEQKPYTINPSKQYLRTYMDDIVN
jgi:hypothetical protein